MQCATVHNYMPELLDGPDFTGQVRAGFRPKFEKSFGPKSSPKCGSLNGHIFSLSSSNSIFGKAIVTTINIWERYRDHYQYQSCEK